MRPAPRIFVFEQKKDWDAMISFVDEHGIKPVVSAEYPLAEAARAHQDLEARKTTGSTILIPGD